MTKKTQKQQQLKARMDWFLTSHKETQIYNGLNTGKGSPSSEAVKIFLVPHMLSLGVALILRAPVISILAAARWKNKIKNTCCFPLKRLPGSHSFVPPTSHWPTLSHMGTPNCKGNWGIGWAAAYKEQSLFRLDI